MFYVRMVSDLIISTIIIWNITYGFQATFDDFIMGFSIMYKFIILNFWICAN